MSAIPEPTLDLTTLIVVGYPWVVCFGYGGITLLLTEFLISLERNSVRLLEQGVAWTDPLWIHGLTLFQMVSPLLVGNQLGWWIGQLPGSTGGYLPMTYVLVAVMVSLSLWRMGRQAFLHGLQLKLGPEERARHTPDRVDKHRQWLWAANGFVASCSGLAVGWVGGWSWLAAMVGGFSYLLVSAFVMSSKQKTTYRTQPAASQMPDGPNWLQMTPIEADLRHLWLLSGRHRDKDFPVFQALLGSVSEPQDTLTRSRWFARQVSAFHAQPRSPHGFQILLPAFQVLPTDAWLADVAIGILGQNRTRFRLALMRLPLLRHGLVLWDRTPAWLKAVCIWLLLYAIATLAVVFLPQTQHILGIGMILLVVSVILLHYVINGRGQNRFIHGYRGWREIMPEWDRATDRQAVPAFLKATAISGVVASGFRRPEILRLLYQGNPAVKRILVCAGLDESCLTPELFKEVVEIGHGYVQRACESNAWIPSTDGGSGRA